MNGKVRDGDGLKGRESYKQRRRAEREREREWERVCVRCRRHAGMNERTESYPFAGFIAGSFSAARTEEDRRRVGGEKCGGEVVIKGEAEGGGRER